ncbi:M50 family metallopeptidase [Clostridium sp. MB40-C1]|uniref:M50 family metallopeptidase n=1 Tax=Clostridium sp. MB40-C1 TaxID=3070996 RepID=UPI0027E08DB0|nr:M50 family metallopeptidase [Clostridium sp. MB40-C1]WMJ82351.1 M50 family metallopeptidase [Clostridium sp. MB40-C1]
MEKQKPLLIKFSKVFMIYIIVLIIIGFKGKVIISFLFVFMHELTHYITARKMGFKGFDIEILPIGAVLHLKDLDDAEPKEDIIISMSGPLFNLVAALIFGVLKNFFYSEYFNFIYLSNMALAIFNLLPAFPLDGGRILRDILSIKTYYKRANKITVNISFIVGFMMIICSLIVWRLKSLNLSILIIGFFIIISSYKEKERIVYLIMGDIIRKKYKFLKRGYIDNRSVSIYCKKTLLEALSIVDKNKYNIFIVLDEDMKTIGITYEESLVEGLKIYGNISIEEYLKSTDEIDKMDKWATMTVEEWSKWNEKSIKG